MSPEETHHYRLEVPPGVFVQILVEQQGVDVELRLEGPEGTWTRDGYYEPGSVDRLSRIVETGGSYRLEVAPRGSGSGVYGLRLKMRAASLADHAAARAEELSFRALVAYASTRLPEAVGLWDRALPLWRRARDPWGEAEALYWSAKALERLKQQQAAGRRYAQAAERYAEAPTTFSNAARQRARSLANAGVLEKDLGRLEAAEAKLRAAVAAWRELGVTKEQAISLGHLALLTRDRGELSAARGMLRECVDLWTLTDAPLARAQALTNLGHVEQDLGHYPESLRHLRAALDVWEREAPRHRGHTTTLNSMGSVYTSMGEYSLAIDRYHEALAPSRQLGDRHLEAVILNNLGRAYRHLEDNDNAGAHLRQALSLSREQDSSDLESDALDNLGRLHLNRGDPSRATDFFQQALELTRKARNRREEAVTLVQLGEALWELGQVDRAATHLQEALDLGRANQDPRVEAQSLSLLARVAGHRHDYDRAEELGEKALSIVESLHSSVLQPDLRRSFAAAQHRLYERHVDLLMDAHRDQPRKDWLEKAFATRERAKARSLLELLEEAKVDLRDGVSPDLLDRERTLRNRVAELEARRFVALTSPDGEATAAELKDSLVASLRKLDVIEAAIRSSSPEYASLTRPVPVSLREAQRDLLGPDDLILAYSLGEPRSFLWGITQRRADSFELPGRDLIHAKARELRRSIEAGTGPDVGRLARELSSMLLAPASDRLRGKRLWILPDGLLHAVPFAMLPDPSSKSSAKPLLEEHPILHAPSLSILAELRKRSTHTADGRSCIAVIADPVLGPTDPRWERDTSDETTSSTRGGLERLIYSAREAETILSFVAPERRLSLEGFEASVPNVLDGSIHDCGIVHFATHGLVDGENPELSGLALSVRDAAGRPLKGLLSLQDLYDLELTADLVTLSACDTALGREVRGEGLVGMTYGFFAAGARTLVASLWDVDDRATTVLMEHFYRAMLEKKRPPVEALRLAQQKLRSDSRWREARYWAAFVVQGPGP